jgi:hypothetical protein
MLWLAWLGGVQALELNAEALAQLRSGEVLVEVGPDPQGAAGLIEAVIEVSTSPRKLWDAMVDCERSKRTLPALKTCRVTERAGDGSFDVREHVVQWVWPLPAVRTAIWRSWREIGSLNRCARARRRGSGTGRGSHRVGPCLAPSCAPR